MKKTLKQFLVAFSCGISINAYSQNLTIGTNTLNVSFQDSFIDLLQKQLIITDMQKCVNNPWGNRSKLIMFKPWQINSEYTGYVSMRKSVCYKNDFEFPEDIITNNTGNSYLEITKKLSDAYTNAFEFVNTYSNEVAAAYNFVSFISSSNFVTNVTSNQIHNYLYI